MIGLLILIGHLLLSGMWFHVAPRMDAKHTYGLEEIGLYSQHIISILGSIVNIIGGTYMTI